LFELTNKRYNYNIDIASLSNKDRLVLYSIILKGVNYLKNVGDYKEIESVIASDLVNEESLFLGVNNCLNYDYESFLRLIYKITTILNKNKEQIVVNDITMLIGLNDIKNIVFYLYNNFFKDEYKKYQEQDNIATFIININEYPANDALRLASFINKLLLSVNIINGVNDIDYLFDNFFKKEKEQINCLLESFFMLIDADNKELNIYFKIIGKEDYNNIGANLLAMIKYWKLMHILERKEEQYMKQYVNISTFKELIKENMCYNDFINQVIKRINENEKNK